MRTTWWPSPRGIYHYIFVQNTATGETWHASKNSLGDFAQGECDTRPSISADGRFVTFMSSASNLVLGDCNRLRDVFLGARP